MVLRKDTDTGSLAIDTQQIYAKMLDGALIRTILPVDTRLGVSDKTFEYHRREDNFKTAYTVDGNNFPLNKSAFETETKNINTISTGFSYTKNELLRLNASLDPFSLKLGRVSTSIGKDEDVIAIAGSGKSGSNNTQGFAHADNKTNVTNQLDLTSVSTLRSTLNGLINELNSNAKDLSTGTFTRLNPMVVMMTQDVENRLEVLASTISDNVVGADIMRDILNRRVGNYQIVTTDLLGATVKSNNDIAKVTTDGTKNFLMYSYNPSHRYLATSPFDTTQEMKHGGLEYRIEEKFGTAMIEPTSAIYSGTVDITA